MKAAVYYENGGLEVFRYEEVPTPVPQAGEVLIKIRFISIEGGDMVQRERRPLPHVPHIVGYQSAGDIVALGPGVTELHVGQRVVAVGRWGSHAEYVAVEAGRTFVLPDGLSYEVGAAVPTTFFAAHESLFTFGHLLDKQYVLIHGGSGALGQTAIQLARQAGAIVIATGSDDAKLHQLKALGSAHEINYRTQDFVQEVLRITANEGVAVVLDSVGGGRNLTRSVQALTYGGRVVFVGVSGRDETLFDPLVLWPKNASLVGFFAPTTIDTERARYRAVVTAFLEQVASGELQVLLDRTFPLREVAAAYQYILDKKATGRVLLIP